MFNLQFLKKARHYALAVLAIGALSLSLIGCNTMEGLGKDVEKGGEAVQDAAK